MLGNLYLTVLEGIACDGIGSRVLVSELIGKVVKDFDGELLDFEKSTIELWRVVFEGEICGSLLLSVVLVIDDFSGEVDSHSNWIFGVTEVEISCESLGEGINESRNKKDLVLDLILDAKVDDDFSSLFSTFTVSLSILSSRFVLVILLACELSES
ncbi:unnamed protein product [[Candida] boidinii]|nr:unnamed protein product [[Candida] boidinii]